ncbi:MAG: tetraacyldisaccharide 4'-kinase [Burkholderiales bacterium]|nr:tetraacyldisaccharide 4'-kinase [Burkholderiales bacterium]
MTSSPAPSGFAQRLVRDWYAPALTALTASLVPLSWLFGALAALRRAQYRRGWRRVERLPVPVIVVGNITVGGSGKTPLAAALAEALRDRGRRPGLVSRGYGGRAHGPRPAEIDSDPAEVGDEPLILAATGLPVFVGRDRAAVGRALLAAHPECDVLVCDDGLQHYRLARDVEIAVVDQARGTGNGHLLPAGPLREPPVRLEAVDAVVRLVSGDASHTRDGDGRSTFITLVAQPWRNLVDPSRVAPAAPWNGPGVYALAGIAHPQRFFAALRAQGIVATERAFADHHPFTARDLALPGARVILMTQKDAVKCTRFADERCWFLPVRATVDPALVDLVLEKIGGS